MDDSCRYRGFLGRAAAATLALLVCAPAAHALRYKGERIDIYTGQMRGRWIIVTRVKDGGATLGTTVRCRPRRKCTPFPARLVFDMARSSDYSFSGTFSLRSVGCALEATVYDLGFEGVYTCDDGVQGSISGRRG